MEEHVVVGQCLREACEVCMDFQQGWDQAAGKTAALSGVENIVREMAGKSFGAGKDERASVLREVADLVGEMRETSSAELQRYINAVS